MNQDQRAVFNAAYRIGVALGRKFEATDMTIELRQAAQLYAATYDGDFPFMVDFRERLANGPMFFSDGQSKAILNCLMADAKRRMADRKPAAPAPTAACSWNLSQVKNARYRVEFADGSSIALRLSDMDTEDGSEWARKQPKGSRNVSLLTQGADGWTPSGWLSPEGCPQGQARKGSVNQALEILAKADDTLAYGLAFARVGSVCFICGRNLDVAESIDAGYGETCAAKWGLPYGHKNTPAAVQAARESAAAAPRIDPETGVEESAEELLALVEATRPAPTPASPAPAAVSLSEAKARGYKRTYEEIFGDD